MNKTEKELVTHLKEVANFNVRISKSIHNIFIELENLQTCMRLAKSLNDLYAPMETTVRPLDFEKYCKALIESQNKLIESVKTIIKDEPKNM